MPAADTVYQTSISINGAISPTLLKALQTVNTETGKIITQEQKLGVESKKAFEGLQKGMAQATEKAKTFALAVKDMLLPLLGISVAFKGLQTIGDTLQTAIDKFRGAKEAALAFKTSIADIVGERKGPAVERLFLEQQADLLSKGMGLTTREGDPIYGKGIIRAIQDKLLKAHVRPSERLIKAIMERAVSVKGGLGITSEDVGPLATLIGDFIRLDVTRMSPEMLTALGLGSRKDLKGMSAAGKAKLIENIFGGKTQIESLIRDDEKLAALMAAQVKSGAELAEVGKPLEELQKTGERISINIERAFLPVLKNVSAAIEEYLSKPLDALDEKVKLFAGTMQLIFAPEMMKVPPGSHAEEIQKYYMSKKGIPGLLERFRDAWNGVILPELERSWSDFVTWAGKQFKAVGDTLNAVILDLEKHKILPEGTLEALQKNAATIGEVAVNLFKAAQQIGQINWLAMQAAAKSLGDAAQHLNDAVNAITGAMTNLRSTLAKAPEAMPGPVAPPAGEKPTWPWFGYGFATGGIVNNPQVGLVAEAGPESIIPLRRDANTLDILSSTLSTLGVNPLDPNAYGHEIFDAMRMGPGGFGGVGPPGFSGYAGGIYYTEYGPAVPGDQPGGPTYDWNSYHRRGAWPGITGLLSPGDVALGHGAQSFYGVSPGQTFVDTRGNTVRFADRSGSKNPMNEDVFRMAAGGIVSRRILSWLGEAGKEAVIPLEGNRGRRALSSLGGGKEHHFHFSPTVNVSGIASTEVVDYLMEEMERRFSNFLDNAAHEHARTAFN